MLQPLISVILPFYNAADTLHDAIESILNQTYQNFELLLVNNNSTDAGGAIAREYALKQEKISYYDEINQGVVFATQTGFKHAKGCFISRMDADDIAHVQKLEKQMNLFFMKPELGVVSCLVENKQHHAIIGDGMEHYVAWTNTLIEHDEIALNRYIESPIINPTALIRREVIDAYGFYKQSEYPEDYELWLRYLAQGVKFEKVPEALLQWHDSVSRLTRNHNMYSTDAFYKIKTKYFVKNNDSLLRTKKVYVWGAGRVTRKRTEMLINEGVSIYQYIDIKENAKQNIISYTDLHFDSNAVILAYVANRGARSLICEFLTQLGYVHGINFFCLA